MISLVEAGEAYDPCETDRNLLRVLFLVGAWALDFVGLFLLGLFLFCWGFFVGCWVCWLLCVCVRSNELGLPSQPIWDPRGDALLF